LVNVSAVSTLVVFTTKNPRCLYGAASQVIFVCVCGCGCLCGCGWVWVWVCIVCVRGGGGLRGVHVCVCVHVCVRFARGRVPQLMRGGERERGSV
jgi:hypothetical protein